MSSLKKTRQIATYLWHTWKGYRLQALLNMTIGLLSVISALAFVWATKLAIDIATQVKTDMPLSTAIFILALILIIELAIGIFSRWIRALLGVKAQNKMRLHIFTKLMNGEWNALRAFHSGNLINRMEQDVNGIVNFLTESIPSLVCTLAQFTGAFFFLFFMDKQLACIVVLILPFFVICSKLYVKRMRKITHNIRDKESAVQSTIQECLQHVLIIKTLRRAVMAAERLHNLQNTLHKEVIHKTRYSTLSSGLINAGFAIGYFATFTWGVFSLQSNVITYGALIAFIQLVGQIQSPVRTLSKFVPIFIEAFTAAERIIEIEQIQQEKATQPTGTTKELSDPSHCTGIKISNLTFAYPSNEQKASKNIFKDFSYDFRPGNIIAIVGETGAGKTTLIRLLLALTQQTEGNILLYDEKGNSAPINASTRCAFSYVPQGNTLLSGTIRENLQWGNPQATDTEMKLALRDAAAHFVFDKPEQLDSRCGEMGDGLSEGQAQRIAIARALLQKASILLLDEATSSLDPETESMVLKNIVSHHTTQTIILITHRPEALKYCQQTLRLK